MDAATKSAAKSNSLRACPASFCLKRLFFTRNTPSSGSGGYARKYGRPAGRHRYCTKKHGGKQAVFHFCNPVVSYLSNDRTSERIILFPICNKIVTAVLRHSALVSVDDCPYPIPAQLKYESALEKSPAMFHAAQPLPRKPLFELLLYTYSYSDTSEVPHAKHPAFTALHFPRPRLGPVTARTASFPQPAYRRLQ